MMAKPWSLRSWMLVALIVVPFFALKEWFGLEYPLWVGWICLVIAGLVGGAILISPDLAAMKSSKLARLLGAVMVTATALGAYQLQNFTE